MLVVHDNDGWHGDVMRVVSSAMTAGGGQSYTLGGGGSYKECYRIYDNMVLSLMQS